MAHIFRDSGKTDLSAATATQLTTRLLALVCLFLSLATPKAAAAIATPANCGPIVVSGGTVIAADRASPLRILRPASLFSPIELINLWKKVNATPMLAAQSDLIETVKVSDGNRGEIKIDVFRVKKTVIDYKNDERVLFLGDPRWAVQALGEKLGEAIGVQWMVGRGSYDLVLAVDVVEMNRRVDKINSLLPDSQKIKLRLKPVDGVISGEDFLRNLGNLEISFTDSSLYQSEERNHDLSHHLATLIADPALVNWATWFNKVYFEWLDYAINHLAARDWNIPVEQVTARHTNQFYQAAHYDYNYTWENKYLSSILGDFHLSRGSGMFDNLLGGTAHVLLEAEPDHLQNLSPRAVLFRPHRETGITDTTTTARELMYGNFLIRVIQEYGSADAVAAAKHTFRFGSAMKGYEADSQFLRDLFEKFQASHSGHPMPFIDIERIGPEQALEIVARMQARRQLLNSVAAGIVP